MKYDIVIKGSKNIVVRVWISLCYIIGIQWKSWLFNPSSTMYIWSFSLSVNSVKFLWLISCCEIGESFARGYQRISWALHKRCKHRKGSKRRKRCLQSIRGISYAIRMDRNMASKYNKKQGTLKPPLFYRKK